MFNRRKRQPERVSWPPGRYLYAHWPLTELYRHYDVTRRWIFPMIPEIDATVELRTDVVGGVSYYFDGVGGGTDQQKVLKLDTGSNDYFDFATDSFSASCWVKYGTSFGTNFPGVIANRTAADSGSKGWGIFLHTSGAPDTGKPFFQIHDGTNQADIIGTKDCRDDSWHFLAVAVDRDVDLIKISIDGGAYTTASCAAVGSLGTGGGAIFQFGARPDSSGHHDNKYIGQLKDVRLWKGHSLIQSEVEAIYREKEIVAAQRVPTDIPVHPSLPKLGPSLPGLGSLSPGTVLVLAAAGHLAQALTCNPSISRRGFFDLSRCDFGSYVNVSDHPQEPLRDSRTVIALSERVAIIETQQKALKDDTGVIRSSIHGINNEMQKFVQAEQRCADALTQLLGSVKDLPTMTQVVAAFTEMRPELRAVIEERQRREGIASFGKKLGLIVASGAALVVIIGGIIGGLVWLNKYLNLPQ